MSNEKLFGAITNLDTGRQTRALWRKLLQELTGHAKCDKCGQLQVQRDKFEIDAGLNDAEIAKSRVFRRQLQNNRRENDPTSIALRTRLAQQCDEARLESTDRRHVEFMTIAVWRLFGNSMPWFTAIGLVRQWDAATKIRQACGI